MHSGEPICHPLSCKAKAHLPPRQAVADDKEKIAFLLLFVSHALAS